MRDTAAIIVAGGRGLRYGGKVRKQFLSLQGHPLIWWSVRAFQESPSIAEIILVVPKDDLALMSSSPVASGRGSMRGVDWIPRQRPRGMTLSGVAGGATRADSVRNGLKSVNPKVRYVAVHDAVRPLVEPKLIESVIAAARKYRAALAACPSKDTVKIANKNGFVESTPPRKRVWLAQTPQIFERKLLEKAHRAMTSPRRIVSRGLSKGMMDPGFRRDDITDDAMMVERLGQPVALVQSPPENIKVTVPVDFDLARRILQERV